MAIEIRPSAGGALEQRPQYQPAAYRSATPSAVAAMSFFTSAGPQPAPAAVVRPGAAFLRLDRLAPLALSTPALALGRIWHLHGAAHSIGDAGLMGALSLGTAVAGCVTTTASAVVTGTVLGLAGGLAASAVAGYAASIWPGLVLWALGTVAGYAVAWHGWRAEARREAERAHEREARQLESSTTVDVAMIGARRDVAVALIGAERDVQVAQIGAEREREFAARYGLSSTVPDVDPDLLRRSPETSAALNAPQPRFDQGIYDFEAESASA
jgi:hypothetical protein